MTSKLDQSLDSIISENRPSKPRKSNKQANNQSNNKQSNRSGGPERRQRRTRNDDTPYSRTPVGFTAPFDNSTAAHLAAANFAAMQQQMQLQLAAQQKQQQQLQKAPKEKPAKQAQAPAVPVKKITGDTIHIANLAKDVTTDDVKEIFEKVGEIRSCSVNYNESGQSLGTATVTFKQSADAERAMNDYDAAEVDGKPMYIKLVGTVSQAPVVVKKKRVEKPAKKAEKNPAQPTIPALNPALNPAALNAFMNPAMMNFGANFPFAAPPAAFNGNQPTNRSQSANQSNNRPNKSNNQTNNRSNGQSTARRGQSSRGGRGGRGGRTASAQPSMADLDAELDSYHK